METPTKVIYEWKAEHVVDGEAQEYGTEAVFEYDDFYLTEPHDAVRITVTRVGNQIDSVYIGFETLEKIYLAAKEAKANRLTNWEE